MKKSGFIFVLGLQVFAASAQYQEEWNKELRILKYDGTYNGMVALVADEQSIYVCGYGEMQEVKATKIFKVNKDGAESWSETIAGWPYRNRDLALYNGSLYSMGDSLTKRNLQGSPIESRRLYWYADSSILRYSNTEKGLIYKDHFYSMCAYEIFWKYDLQGNFKWSINTGGSNLCLRQSKGFLYIACSTPDLSSALIKKYDTEGNLVWSVAAGMMLINIVTDTSGNCYAMGGGIYGACYVTKFDPDGTVLWSKPLKDISPKNGIVYKDSLYICGSVADDDHSTISGDDTKAVFTVLSIDSGQAGSRVMYHVDPICDWNREQFTHIYTDGEAIYCGGNKGTEFKSLYLVKFSDARFVSLKEEISDENIAVFPNPTGREFTIRYKGKPASPDKVVIEVRNAMGQIVFNKEYASFSSEFEESIDLNSQSKGVYFIELLVDKKRTVRKIIIN